MHVTKNPSMLVHAILLISLKEDSGEETILHLGYSHYKIITGKEIAKHTLRMMKETWELVSCQKYPMSRNVRVMSIYQFVVLENKQKSLVFM
jgi:hypothetical protein